MMTVKQVIEELKKFPLEMECCIMDSYTEVDEVRQMVRFDIRDNPRIPLVDPTKVCVIL